MIASTMPTAEMMIPNGMTIAMIAHTSAAICHLGGY